MSHNTTEIFLLYRKELFHVKRNVGQLKNNLEKDGRQKETN